MKYSEKLHQRYKEEIRGWDWEAIKTEAEGNAQERMFPCVGRSDDEEYRGMIFLGTVFALSPSGKYYMPWTTNQTVRDEIRDSAFYSALDDIAEEHGMWIESGEGDPCDIFACCEAEPTPEDGDIFVSPSGPLGSRNRVTCIACPTIYDGNPGGTDKAIRNWMEKNQYWPNVWNVSDHGNMSLRELEDEVCQA